MLNKDYYETLIKKHEITNNSHDVAALTSKMILSNYDNKVLHINFPKKIDIQEIVNDLYVQFARKIFVDFAEFPPETCDKVKRIGGTKKQIFTIQKIENGKVVMVNTIDRSQIMTVNYDGFIKKYIPVQQNAQKGAFLNIQKYFSEINNHGFLPTYFSKKLVIIGGQHIWSKLENKNCILTIYLPNTRDGEQTLLKSIPALEDCMVYVTPKYDVCYEEILQKNIGVDTIIVCDADLEKVPQIIQDKSKYNFNLIVLSNDIGQQKISNTLFWNWKQEEIDLLEENTSKSISIRCIHNEEFINQFLHFENCMQYVRNLEYPIQLSSYGYFLRLAMNAIQTEQFDDLLWRLQQNKELEQNEGGYEDFGENNPKEALSNLIQYLKKENPKQRALLSIISSASKNTLIISDREDLDFLKFIRNNKCQIVTNAEFKRLQKNNGIQNKTLIFYSFNGKKDFEILYHLQNEVQLVLYQQEKELFDKQLQIHKKQLEAELTSEDRVAICGIKYNPIIEPEIKINPTLEQIIERLEQRSHTAYEGYKNESDSLLDDLEEKITYRITFTNNSDIEIESNETVFNEKNALLKAYKLKANDKIRIYPKEELAENLLKLAVEEEPEIYGKIDEHSTFWKSALEQLKNLYGNDLYNNLKQKGLRVLPATVESYFKNDRKFPMYNSDLHAILELNNQANSLSEINKTKRLYNSTMIALGRGIKQELKQFLQEKTLGDILKKKNFTKETLQKFIEQNMPLLTITNIEEINHE